MSFAKWQEFTGIPVNEFPPSRPLVRVAREKAERRVREEDMVITEGASTSLIRPPSLEPCQVVPQRAWESAIEGYRIPKKPTEESPLGADLSRSARDVRTLPSRTEPVAHKDTENQDRLGTYLPTRHLASSPSPPPQPDPCGSRASKGVREDRWMRRAETAMERLQRRIADVRRRMSGGRWMRAWPRPGGRSKLWIAHWQRSGG